MEPYFSDDFFNPSALYGAGTRIKRVIESARSDVAHVLGVRSPEIIFTAGCTEANNLAISGVMRQFPDGECLISAIEHDSVRNIAEQYRCRTLGVGSGGLVSSFALKEKISDTTVLISVIYANNEIGTVQNISELTAVVAHIRKERGPEGLPLYFHTDASQAPNSLPVHASRLGVDMMSLNGGKIYGPKASGCLYVRRGTRLKPVIYGGGQENGLRSGTENVASIVGFARALSDASTQYKVVERELSSLRDRLIERLQGIGGIVNGERVHRLANNISVTFPGVDNETMLYKLDQMGFMVATGSACHARSGRASSVLSAIGLSDEYSRSTLRITLGKTTTVESVDKLADAIKALIVKR
jgi:cysteine desulfurase